LVREDLILPVTLGDLGEVRDLARVEFDALLDELPTDPGDDLFAPGIEKTGKRDSSRRHGATKLAVAFEEQGLRAEAPCLDRGDGSGGAATDHQHVDLLGEFGTFVSRLLPRSTSRSSQRSRHRHR
jgi:hypothetical protein